MRKTPATARPASLPETLRGGVERLHRLWEARLLDPTDSRLLDATWDLADALWAEGLQSGVNPHRVCPERYCDCHVTLMLHQPPTLPGLDGPTPW